MALQGHPDKENQALSRSISLRDLDRNERVMDASSETPTKTPARPGRTKTPTKTPTKPGKGRDFAGQAGGHFPVKNTFIHYGTPVQKIAVTTPPKTVPPNFAPEGLPVEGWVPSPPRTRVPGPVCAGTPTKLVVPAPTVALTPSPAVSCSFPLAPAHAQAPAQAQLIRLSDFLPSPAAPRPQPSATHLSVPQHPGPMWQVLSCGSQVQQVPPLPPCGNTSVDMGPVPASHAPSFAMPPPPLLQAVEGGGTGPMPMHSVGGELSVDVFHHAAEAMTVPCVGFDGGAHCGSGFSYAPPCGGPSPSMPQVFESHVMQMPQPQQGTTIVSYSPACGGTVPPMPSIFDSLAMQMPQPQPQPQPHAGTAIVTQTVTVMQMPQSGW